MKTLNAAMALRGAETGSFTTIDLITCRPETGEAAFFKYGAAPSYVKKGGTVRRITGGTLPAGLRGGAAAPDVTRATLEPGWQTRAGTNGFKTCWPAGMERIRRPWRD